VGAILHNDMTALHKLFLDTRQHIINRALDISDFARTEVLHSSTAAYDDAVSRGLRGRSPTFETLRAAGLEAKAGERIGLYASSLEGGPGTAIRWRLAEEWDPHFPDESTSYYLHRLEELAGKFQLFFTSKDFSDIFSPDGLFPFDPLGITVLVLPVERATPLPDHPDEDHEQSS
jgi:hypothetical protein